MNCAAKGCQHREEATGTANYMRMTSNHLYKPRCVYQLMKIGRGRGGGGVAVRVNLFVCYSGSTEIQYIVQNFFLDLDSSPFTASRLGKTQSGPGF